MTAIGTAIAVATRAMTSGWVKKARACPWPARRRRRRRPKRLKRGRSRLDGPDAERADAVAGGHLIDALIQAAERERVGVRRRGKF